MADRAFDEADPDDLLAKLVVANPGLVLCKVNDRVRQHFSSELVGWTGNRGAAKCGLERREDLVHSAVSQ